MSSGFQVRATDEDGRATIVLSGEIDGQAAPVVVQAFETLVANGPPVELVLDMSGVSFIDSAGLRAMIEVERAARASELPLRVNSPDPRLLALLRTTGLTQRLTPGPRAAPATSGEFTERVEVRLPRDLRAAARARAEIREALGGVSPDDLAVATLLTSEVVTNAVIHSVGAGADTIRLLITVAPGWVGVQVIDPGTGFDPQRPPPRAPEQGGRGLLLVDQLASRWGAAPSSSSPGWFSVWFELDLGTVSLAATAAGT